MWRQNNQGWEFALWLFFRTKNLFFDSERAIRSFERFPLLQRTRRARRAFALLLRAKKGEKQGEKKFLQRPLLKEKITL